DRRARECGAPAWRSRLLDWRAVSGPRIRVGGGARGDRLRVQRAEAQQSIRRAFRAEPGVRSRDAEGRDDVRGDAASAPQEVGRVRGCGDVLDIEDRVERTED